MTPPEPDPASQSRSTRPGGGAPIPARPRCAVIVNLSAGGVPAVRGALDGLESRLADAGWETRVHLVRPDEVAPVVARHLDQEPTLIAVGGGDGTLRSAAQELAGSHHVLGVLPLGTMNRFARALGIPMAIDEAVEVLIRGEDASVDLGEVNGHVFLNTCSIGLYPELARMRERRRARHPHWPNFLRWAVDTLAAGWHVLRSWRLVTFRLRLDDRVIAHRVPLLLVTSNPLDSQGRPSEGVLGVYIPRAVRPLRLVALTLAAVVVGPRETRPLESLDAEELVLEVPPRLPVAIDGEVHALSRPLRMRCRAGACRVRRPAGRGSRGA